MKTPRLVIGSITTALAHPRVWLTMWALVTLAALLQVLPVVAHLDGALGSHPAAGHTLDQSLDVDFARHYPTARIDLTASGIAMFLAFALLAGGVLAAVGTREKFTYAGFLGHGGRLFLRNLRVLLIGVLVSAVVFWGVERLDHWIRQDLVYDLDTGPVSFLQSPWTSLEFWLDALSWLWGFVFLCLLFVSKMAMARLAAHDQRSALLAWLRSLGSAVRHPLRISITVGLWLVLLMAGSHGFGELTVYLLEVRGELWLGLLAGQAGVLWTQILFLSFLLAARATAVPQGAVAEVDLEPDFAMDNTMAIEP